jgi:hypothetical protein
VRAERAGLRLLVALAAMVLPARAQGTDPVIDVATIDELRAALAAANAAGGRRTIRLADGVYALTDTLQVTAPGITLVGRSGDAARVVIQGDAMRPDARVGNLVRVSASGTTLRHLTLQRSRWHLVQVAGESDADGFSLLDCVMRDSYEQMLKVSVDPARPTVTADGGRVERCRFEYSAGVAPNWYTGGIDALGARDWVVRGNTFRGIASPGERISQFAVHFWAGSANALVERNLILDCDRGIGFGLDGRGNTGGTIRNNMIHHAGAGPFADVGISLVDSPGSAVHHNTIFLRHGYPAAIEYRFAATRDVRISNNLANRPVLARDGASAALLAANVRSAEAAWFRDPPRGDLHLVRAVPGVVDSGTPVDGLPDDYDGDPRPLGPGVDVGADEWRPSRAPGPPTNVRAL